MFALCEMTFVLMSMNIAWPKKKERNRGSDRRRNENKAPLPGTSEGDAVLKHPTKAIKAPKISNVDFMYTFDKNVSTFLVCSMLSHRRFFRVFNSLQHRVRPSNLPRRHRFKIHQQ